MHTEIMQTDAEGAKSTQLREAAMALLPSTALSSLDSAFIANCSTNTLKDSGISRNFSMEKPLTITSSQNHGVGWSGLGKPTQWQSSCAVLTSQWAAQVEKESSSISLTSSSNGSSVISTSTTTSMTLQDARGSAFRETFKDLVTLPKPLSIEDLANPPTHGSHLRVAYQGVPGAYSESAATKAYPKCEAVPCEQFEAAFQAVELWIADRAVLPIENSLGGSIHRNYDLLLRHRLHIVGEVQLAVHHCLLGVPGVRKEELKRVISHPQALSQCEHTLAKLGVARESVDDTAGAAQFIAANKLKMRDTGAVASARAAEIYGLDILQEGIQDESGNVTRFLMLAREPIIPRTDRPFKTSIVFALEEEPGALFKALSAFALRNINLTKIESRPQRKRPLRVVDDSNHGSAKYFEYLVYIDFEASMADPRAQNALGQLQEFASFLRVLGSYPMDMTPVRTTSSSSSSSSTHHHNHQPAVVPQEGGNVDDES